MGKDDMQDEREILGFGKEQNAVLARSYIKLMKLGECRKRRCKGRIGVMICKDVMFSRHLDCRRNSIVSVSPIPIYMARK